jgi:hypothetical protein
VINYFNKASDHNKQNNKKLTPTETIFLDKAQEGELIELLNKAYADNICDDNINVMGDNL